MTPDFFSTSHFSRFNSFFSLIFFFFFCICTALVQDQVINFLPVGVFFRLIINSSGSGCFLRVFQLKSVKSKSGGLGSHDRVRTRAYAVVLRQGNVMETDTPNRRGLRVPVRPNLRKFLVKCSTSGGFFVNFYTLFFSTTSSILLRKV